MAGLLNEAVEAQVCKQMLAAIDRRVGAAEEVVTGSILERDKYLMKMGALLELKTLAEEQQRIHDSNFRI